MNRASKLLLLALLVAATIAAATVGVLLLLPQPDKGQGHGMAEKDRPAARKPPAAPGGGLPTQPVTVAGPETPPGEFWLEQDFPSGAAEGTRLFFRRPDGSGEVRIEIGARAVKLTGTGLTDDTVQLDAPGLLRRLIVRRAFDCLDIARQDSPSVAPKPLASLDAEKLGGRWRTAVETPAGVQPLPAPRIQPLGPVTFADDFAGPEPSGAWRAVSGRWELSAINFAENSANAFSLRCGAGREIPGSPLARGRERATRSGIGMMVSTYDNLPKIERISGNSPAEAAGLREDDILVEVNGRNVLESPFWEISRGLRGGSLMNDARLKILRPGERSFRDVTVRPGQYTWGRIRRGSPLAGSSDAMDSREALALAGERFWSRYRFAASFRVEEEPAPGSGVGLAFCAAGAGDCWRYDWKANEAGGELRLVRVTSGREEVLASAPWRPAPWSWYRLAVEARGGDAVAWLDGVKVLEARTPGAFAGKVGLWAASPLAASFDDAEVRSPWDGLTLDEALAPPARAKESPGLMRSWEAMMERLGPIAGLLAKPSIRPSAVREDDMQEWGNPASDWVRLSAEDRLWYRYPLPGDCAVWMESPRFDVLEIGLSADRAVPGSGLVARLSRKARTAEILLGKRQVGSGALTDELERLSFSRAGGMLRLRSGALDLFAPEPEGAPPASGDRVWMRGLLNAEEPGSALTASTGSFDWTFDRAPADWLAVGPWDMANKWICDPRWSWLAARSDESLAALWGKWRFRGDARLDAFIALMMTSDDEPFERPGDLNLALDCSTGDLASGYALVFGGENCTVTRLYRKGMPVAESREASALPASNIMEMQPKPELHQRWFHVGLVVRGPRVSAEFDGREILSYEDPEPLAPAGGHACIWTVRNGIMVARARVACSDVERIMTPAWGGRRFDDGAVRNSPAGSSPPWTAVKRLPDARNGRPVYRVESASGGGDLAVELASVKSWQAPGRALRFDFRASPGTKVDLLLSTGELAPRVRLTGPADGDGLAPVIAEAPGLADDGEWHAVEIDVASALSAWRARRNLPAGGVDGRLRLGCASNEGYLLAGIGGNGRGSWYEFTAPEVVPANTLDTKPPSVAGTVPPWSGGGGERILWKLSDDRSGLDLSGVSVSVGSRRFTPAPGGLEVEVDDSSLAGTVALDLARAGFAAEAGAQAKFVLSGVRDRAGNAAPAESFGWTPESADDRSGPEIEVSIPSRPAALSFDFEAPGRARFASGEGSLSPLDADGVLAVPREGGGHALRVENTSTGSAFGVRLPLAAGIDAALHPVVEFDYRMRGDVPLNLVLDRSAVITLTDRHGRESPWTRNVRVLGSVDGIVADGTWRRASINLLKPLTEDSPGRMGFDVSELDIADFGWSGNRAGTSFEMDNLSVVPLLPKGGFDVCVRAFDLSGVKAVAAVVDVRPDLSPGDERAEDVTAASGQAEGAGEKRAKPLVPSPSAPAEQGWRPPGSFTVRARFSDGLSDGRAYLHVRAKDLAGNWGPTVHLPVIVKSKPPSLSLLEPRPDEASASRVVKLGFDDALTIDPSTVSLRLGGVEVRAFSLRTRFNRTSGEMLLDASGREFDEAFKPGALATLRVERALDLVGNSLASPVEWSWKYDPSSDKTPPPAPRVRYTTARRMTRIGQFTFAEMGYTNDFEDLLAMVRAMRGCSVERTSTTSAFGRWSAEVRSSDVSGRFRLRIRDKYWSVLAMPHLRFDYKVPPGSELALEVDLMGSTRRIALLGERAGEVYHGRSGPLLADGAWHAATVELPGPCAEEVDRMPVKYARGLYLVGRLPPAGAMNIDNVELARSDWAGGRFEWESPEDSSGIRGFSWACDRTPDTAPPEVVAATSRQSGPESSVAGEFQPGFPSGGGKWYFHLRAVDGAGNWGATSHCEVDYGELGPAAGRPEPERGVDGEAP